MLVNVFPVKKTKNVVEMLIFGGFSLIWRGFVNYQEALGLDILVHGEAERTDMVEFFGQQLEGFAFTENGWVQVNFKKNRSMIFVPRRIFGGEGFRAFCDESHANYY